MLIASAEALRWESAWHVYENVQLECLVVFAMLFVVSSGDFDLRYRPGRLDAD